MNQDVQKFFNNLYDNVSFETYLKFLVIYFIFIWIAILLWVEKDIYKRTNSFFYRFISIVLALILPIVGLIIYLIIRPKKTLLDKERLEIDENLDMYSGFVEKRLDNKNIISNRKFEIHCLNCSKPVLEDFKFCPFCKAKIKSDCKKCGKEVRAGWKICPYCGDDNEEKPASFKLSKKK